MSVSEGRSAMILVAESEPVIAQAVRERLGADGHAVSWVKSIRDAREALRQSRPDLMVLDVALETDGLELFQAIRFAPENPPAGVVVITEARDVRRRELAQQLGAAAVVTKPVRTERLAALVRDLLAWM